jgi:hypothetical protein
MPASGGTPRGLAGADAAEGTLEADSLPGPAPVRVVEELPEEPDLAPFAQASSPAKRTGESFSAPSANGPTRAAIS